MKILLIALGSAGDVHPIVGLGLALRKRGHAVTLATNPYFEPLVERVGLSFEPVGAADDIRQVMANPDLWHPRRGFYLIVEQMLLAQLDRLYELAAEYSDQPDCVVAAPVTALGARVAHDQLKVPLVTIHLQPAMLRSAYRAPVLPPLQLGDRVPAALKRCQYWLADKLLVDRLINRGLTPFRARHGLPPVRRVIDQWWHAPQRVVGLFPDWFAPPQPDWPAQLALTSFPLWDEQGYCDLPAGLAAFLAAGDAPIVFTPGSANQHGHAFFAAAVEACRRLRRRGVLLTRFGEQIPARLPDDVRHFDFVPLGSLLPRAAAVVHHAGIGTLAQGLAAGIPHLAMPLSHDQPDNADRLRRLGVGTWLKPRQFQGPRVADALSALLGSPQVVGRARELAARFDTAAALAATCDYIEQAGSRPARRELGSVAPARQA